MFSLGLLNKSLRLRKTRERKFVLVKDKMGAVHAPIARSTRAATVIGVVFMISGGERLRTAMPSTQTKAIFNRTPNVRNLELTPAMRASLVFGT